MSELSLGDLIVRAREDQAAAGPRSVLCVVVVTTWAVDGYDRWHEPGNVRHVHQQVGADRVRDRRNRGQ